MVRPVAKATTPTWATGKPVRHSGTGRNAGLQSHQSRRAAGFTLIEVLVVLVIVGIVVTIAALRFGDSDGSRIVREAERLSLLLELARDESISSGNTLGWSAEEVGYRFWRRDAEGIWRELTDHENLRPRTLPEGMTLGEIRVNRVPLGPEEKLMFTPSGVNSAFTLLLKQGEAWRRLNGDVMGRIEEESVAVDAAPKN